MNVMVRLERAMPSHIKPMTRKEIDAYGKRQVQDFHRKNRE
ncbi:hypothetical protein [Photobacterium sanguinicancri]|nr:hypothetical protein [Photobacterium sanguinicancri]MDO6498562.1 hypothetical protein [Photobacterium sanguinicancri]